MKQILILFSFGLFLVACSNSSEKKIVRVEKHNQFKKLEKVIANRQLSIEVEGMTCEHACGGSIRMALMDTKGVQRVKFDFVPERKVNTAIVLFDKNKINADEIVSIIEKTNNGQFTTHKIESSSYVDEKLKTSSSTKATNSSDFSPIHVETNEIRLPSLVDLLKSFIF